MSPGDVVWFRSWVDAPDATLRTRLRAALVLTSAGEVVPSDVGPLLHLVADGPWSDEVLYRSAGMPAPWRDPILADRTAVILWERDGTWDAQTAAVALRAAWGWTDQLERVHALVARDLADDGREADAGLPRLGRDGAVGPDRVQRADTQDTVCASSMSACVAWVVERWLEREGEALPLVASAASSRPLAAAWWGARAHTLPHVAEADAWLVAWGQWLARLEESERRIAILAMSAGRDSAANTPLAVLRHRGGPLPVWAATMQLLGEAAGAPVSIAVGDEGARVTWGSTTVVHGRIPDEVADQAASVWLVEALRGQRATTPMAEQRITRMAERWSGIPGAATEDTVGERIGALVAPISGSR
jgi:hypothetical protein